MTKRPVITPDIVKIEMNKVYGIFSRPKRKNMKREVAFENMIMYRQVDPLTCGFTPNVSNTGPYINPPPRPNICPMKPERKDPISIFGRFRGVIHSSLECSFPSFFFKATSLKMFPVLLKVRAIQMTMKTTRTSQLDPSHVDKPRTDGNFGVPLIMFTAIASSERRETCNYRLHYVHVDFSCFNKSASYCLSSAVPNSFS